MKLNRRGMSILNSCGDIDAGKLQKELEKSLQEDIRFRLTDNAKKKAAKNSVNYDEFRVKVSCAHLKPLARSEIDSLRNVKNGWQKSKSGSVNNSSPLVLEQIGVTSELLPVALASKQTRIKVKYSIDIEKKLASLNLLDKFMYDDIEFVS